MKPSILMVLLIYRSHFFGTSTAFFVCLLHLFVCCACCIYLLVARVVCIAWVALIDLIRATFLKLRHWAEWTLKKWPGLTLCWHMIRYRAPVGADENAVDGNIESIQFPAAKIRNQNLTFVKISTQTNVWIYQCKKIHKQIYMCIKNWHNQLFQWILVLKIVWTFECIPIFEYFSHSNTHERMSDTYSYKFFTQTNIQRMNTFVYIQIFVILCEEHTYVSSNQWYC